LLFSHILTFIVVMTVFEAYRPGTPALGRWESLSWAVALWLWLWAGSRLAVGLFLRRLKGARPPSDPAAAARRLELYLSSAALACLLLLITVLDMKAHLLAWPPAASWETVQGLVAAGLYFLHLGLAWSVYWPLERQALGQPLSRPAFVWGQARLVAPVVFPWLGVTLLRDLLLHLVPGSRAFLDTSLGDLTFLLVFLVMMAAIFPPLVRSWWGCRPLAAGPVRDLSQAVLDRAGVTVGGILTWPALGGRALTAGMLGIFPGLRYLLLTPGLLDALGPQELAGVVAHEAGHVRHRHMFSYLAFFVGFFVLAQALSEPLSLLAQAGLFWLAGTGWGASFLTNPQQSSGVLGVAMALPLLLVLLVYVRFVMGFFMRHFERQADLFALDVMGQAEPLVEALERIGRMTGGSRDVPSWHHFSIAQRVTTLRQAEGKGDNAKTHGLVIRRGMKTYALGMALTCLLGWGMSALDLGQDLRQGIIIRLLESKLEADPQDASLRLNLGVILFEAGEEDQALVHLKRAFELAPRDPEVLNSLAWALATAEDSDLRDPQAALVLAGEAVRLSPQPHIWDTLAEAHYVNGQYAKAAAASRAALAAAPRERLEYFQAQVERFRRAAGETP
jgi:Zn-dependent protease with chaperone function